MREHRTADHITDGPDIQRGGATLVIHLDIASFADIDAGQRIQQTRGFGSPTNGDDDFVDRDLVAALTVVVFEDHTVIRHLGFAQLCAEADVQPLLLELPLRLARNLPVGHKQELVHRLEYRYFRTEALPNAAELQPDDARTDNAESPRHRVELQRALRIDDALAVDRRRRQLDGRRSGGQDHVLALQ